MAARLTVASPSPQMTNHPERGMIWDQPNSRFHSRDPF